MISDMIPRLKEAAKKKSMFIIIFSGIITLLLFLLNNIFHNREFWTIARSGYRMERFAFGEILIQWKRHYKGSLVIINSYFVLIN